MDLDKNYSPILLPKVNRRVSSKLGLFQMVDRSTEGDIKPVQGFFLKSSLESGLIWMKAEELMNNQEISEILDLAHGVDFKQVLLR